MNKKIALNLGSIRMSHYKDHLKIFKGLGALLILFGIFITGCKKDEYTGEVTGLCPIVISTDPMDKAVDVVTNKLISATFNTSMNATTITSSSFTIKQGVNLIAGTVAPTSDGAVFTFKPSADLLPFTTYAGKMAKGVTDTLRTAMVEDYNWTFTTLPRITLTANPVNGGTLTGAGDFAQSSTATVSAAASTGFVFSNWTENGIIVSTSSSYTFKMNGNRSLVANFAPVPVGNSAVNLSANPAAGGNTTGAGAYATGSLVTVTAAANTGYTFTNWTENNVVVSNSSSYQFILTGNRALVANFKLIPSTQFALILSSNPPAGGTTDGEGPYAAGTSVTAIAAVNTGYNFTNWTENGAVVSTSANYTFPLNGNRTLVANFTIKTYTLNVTAVNGSVTKNPDQATYNHGTNVLLTAAPNTGYQFTGWSGDASGNANPLTVSMIANKNITANFAVIVLPATILASASNFGAFGGNAGITNQGLNTMINNGEIGTTAASTLITGFHDGLTGDVYTETPLNKGNVSGGIFTAPPAPGTATSFTVATKGLADANTAYIFISPASKPGGSDPGAGELGGLTLAPGVYKSAGATFDIKNGDLTLDAKGDPNAQWFFQTAARLTVGIAGPAGARSVKLINGALAKNVYWYVGSDAVINAAGGGVMVGNIISSAGVTFSTAGNAVQTVLNGRALSLNASVTMVNTTINVPAN